MFPQKPIAIFYRIVNPLIALLLRVRGVVIGEAPRFFGFPQVYLHEGSSIKIGSRVIVCSDSSFTALSLNHPTKISTVRPNASIVMGDDVGMSGACIVCAKSITIGSEVMMGANVMIIDTDFHPVEPIGRRFSDDPQRIGVAPVVIGDNVFLGAGAVVLKGASIGHDSVVAAAAVVVAGEYAAGIILAGNPAQVVGCVYRK